MYVPPTTCGAGHINRSLLTLGMVIKTLSERKKGSSKKDMAHVPYRNSKLTRILRPCSVQCP